MRIFQLPAGTHSTSEAGLRAGVGLTGLALTLVAILLAHGGGLS